MSLLIDGYNLLHATGIFGRGPAPGSLQRSRQALLNFLAASLPPEEVARTVVVFDAAAAPPGLPRTMQHGGMTVRYAERDREADDLIEELIKADSAPRKLTVVSSDHRLQRAARRRRATAVDSDVWYAALRAARQQRSPAERVSSKRVPQSRGSQSRETQSSELQSRDREGAAGAAPLSEAEVEQWLREFGDAAPEESEPVDENSIFNPFPPGYGEDVEE